MSANTSSHSADRPVLPLLDRGSGSIVSSADGREWLDLIIGFGAAFLGHSHPHITAALQEQAGRLMVNGRFPNAREETIERLLAAVLPRGLRPGGFMSTGMEAAEFALRVAATRTSRQEFAGFAHSMHGKSAMTAALCWKNAPLRPERLHTLPSLDMADEDRILQELRDCLGTGRIAALLVEPIQGSNAGHQGSIAFHEEAMAMCRATETLFIMDETLTGLYRTGPAFYSTALASPPDALIFAKNMGNGFPVSAIAIGPDVQITPAALPGSTFAGNPLALAAVQATLETMARLPMAENVAALERVARMQFESLEGDGIAVRGCGALWCVELSSAAHAVQAATTLRGSGILASATGRALRILPAATLPLDTFSHACKQVARACRVAGR